MRPLIANFTIVLRCNLTTAASAAEWFFIAVLSTAMKKDKRLCVLCDSSDSRDSGVKRAVKSY